MTTDCMHQTIEIGDWIAFNPPYVKGLSIGRVTKLTPKGVTCSYGKDLKQTCNRHSYDVFIVTDQRRIAKEKNPELFI